MCALPHGGQLTSAAIVGQDGGVWAQSANFPAITPAEVAALNAGFSDPGSIAATGIVVGGQKARRLPRATEAGLGLALRCASAVSQASRRLLNPRPCALCIAVPVHWGRFGGRAPREEGDRRHNY